MPNGFPFGPNFTPPTLVTAEPTPALDRAKWSIERRQRPRRPVALTQKGAERRLAQEMAAGRITSRQFLAGVGALSKATVGAGTSSITDVALGLASPSPRASKPARTTPFQPIPVTWAGSSPNPFYNALLRRRASPKPVMGTLF